MATLNDDLRKHCTLIKFSDVHSMMFHYKILCIKYFIICMQQLHYLSYWLQALA